VTRCRTVCAYLLMRWGCGVSVCECR
jgi:hypothetical protein